MCSSPQLAKTSLIPLFLCGVHWVLREIETWIVEDYYQLILCSRWLFLWPIMKLTGLMQWDRETLILTNYPSKCLYVTTWEYPRPGGKMEVFIGLKRTSLYPNFHLLVASGAHPHQLFWRSRWAVAISMLCTRRGERMWQPFMCFRIVFTLLRYGSILFYLIL